MRSDTEAMTQEIMKKYIGVDMSSMIALRDRTVMGSASSMMSSSMALWKELLPGDNGKPVNEVIRKQYDLIYGSWPASYDEIILFVDENNEIEDMTLYALGLKSEEEIKKLMEAAINQTTIDYDVQKWSYEEICNMDFRTILSSDCYTYDEKTGIYTDLRNTEAGLKYLYDNALVLHVVGIAKPSKNSIAATNRSYIGYTSELTKYIIDQAAKSETVKAQKENHIRIFSPDCRLRIRTVQLQRKKAAEFKEYISSLDVPGKANAYINIMSIPSEEATGQFVANTLANMTRTDMEAAIAPAIVQQTGMDEATIAEYISSMSDDDLKGLFAQALTEQYRAKYAEQVRQQMSAMTNEQLLPRLSNRRVSDRCVPGITMKSWYSRIPLEENLIKLGCVDLESPASINLFASSFANKDVIKDAIAVYNENVDDLAGSHIRTMLDYDVFGHDYY